jgi:hypothetical protein
MLQSKNWGSITWNLLHTIIDKCQFNDNFDSYKDKLIYIIKSICLFTPINEYSYNSNIFFGKFQIDKIRNLQELKKQIYLLHNFINSKINKALFNYSDLSIYSNMDIINIFNIFVYFYNNNILIKKTPNYSRMVNLIKDINVFLNIYIIPYSIKNNIQKEPEVAVIENEIVEEVEPEVAEIVEEVEPEVAEIVEEVIPDVAEIVVEHDVAEIVVEHDVAEIVEIEEQKEVIQEKKPRLININLITRTNKKTFSRDIHSNISIIDDKFLPSVELNLPEAILEMKKNENCLPLDAYIERWNRLKNLKNTKKPITEVDDKLLPPLNLSLPLAIHKIKTSPKCVPFDSYIKRWNELKTQDTYKKKYSTPNKK